jgi:hypothetical protein
MIIPLMGGSISFESDGVPYYITFIDSNCEQHVHQQQSGNSEFTIVRPSTKGVMSNPTLSASNRKGYPHTNSLTTLKQSL